MDNVIKAIGSAVRGLRNKIQSAISESKSYTDSKVAESKSYTDSKVAESKSYTDAKVKEGLPAVSALDNGKFLRVSNGKWAAEFVPYAEDGEY